jgi:hypothetical protein
MRRITHILVATLAASALAASTATAKPTDRVDRYDSPTSSLAGTTTKQDLRGEHAQDAARLAAETQIQRGEQVRKTFFRRRQKQDLRGEHARDAARFNGAPSRGTAPVFPSYRDWAPKPSAQRVSAPAHKPADDGSDIWLIVGIAFGASALIAGSAVGLIRRSRVRVAA